MSLSPEDTAAIIKVRMENARTTVQDAQLLRDAGSLRSSINRAYYAMFYAASALALSRGLSLSKHSAVISFFHRDLVKPGLLGREHGRALQKAFEDRSEADYQDYLRVTPQQVDARIAEARDFIDVVSTYLGLA